MTVVIDIDKSNNKRYASNSLKFSTQDEFKLADELNELIKKKITNYVLSVGLKQIKKDRVLYYWEIGNILREIYLKSGLVDSEERDLFYKNVRLHLNNDIFPGDDIARNRNIPEQFFRLAGFKRDIIEKVKWTTWSYLFDSPLLARIKNFDRWFSENLAQNGLIFDQAFSRLWFQAINVIFKNIEIDDWADDLVLSSIDCLFKICIELVKCGYKAGDRRTKDILKKKLLEKRKEFILFKSGSLSKEQYLIIILSEVTKEYNHE